MRLEEALTEMRAIRSQLNRLQVVSCYRSATAAASGTLALAAAVLQPLAAQRNFGQQLQETFAAEQALFFLGYWSLVAFICVLIIGTEMGWRYWKISASHQRRHTRQSLAEFLPNTAVGVVLGCLLVFQQPEHAALLPGLWSILFGLGVFATLKRLPPGSCWVVVHYLIAGFLCIKFGTGKHALAPWTMAATFGLGQLLAAVVLRRAMPESASSQLAVSEHEL